MAQATNMAKAIHNTRFSANLPKTPKPKSLNSLWLGSEFKTSDFCALKCQKVVGNSVVTSPFKISASVATKEKPSKAPEEIVLQPIKEISGTVKLPGSKSLSNRILLLAALAEMDMEDLLKALTINTIYKQQDHCVSLNDCEDIELVDWKRSIISHLYGSFSISLEEMKSSLSSQWQIKDDFSISIFCTGYFKIVFGEENDVLHVANNGLWKLKNSFLSCKQWRQDTQLNEYDFHIIPVWIQMVGLPLERHTYAQIKKAAGAIGNVRNVSGIDSEVLSLECSARALVDINIKKPLVKHSVVRMEGEKSIKL